jgi:hypothetical protein
MGRAKLFYLKSGLNSNNSCLSANFTKMILSFGKRQNKTDCP